MTLYKRDFLWQREADVSIVREIWSGIYEREAKVQQGDIVVDAGAHIGSFTVKVAGVAEKVVAFEPEPENFKTLRLNAEQFPNVEIHEKALWSSTRRTMLRHHRYNVGGHTLLPLPTELSDYNLEVEAMRLDDAVDETNFIKMDVEGAEIEALRGASRLLSECRPVVVLEAHPIEPLEAWWGALMEALPGYELRPSPTPGDMWCRKIVTALPASTPRCA